MKVSLSWLKEYVSVEMKAEELADALTMTGLEVESLSDRYEYLDNVLAGRIIKVSPHPAADKLKLCDADIGSRVIRVVCGAPNAKENLIAPLALPGTVLPDGSRVEKSTIRGESSEGMLCSQGELGLGTDRSGIMILDSAVSPGKKLARALGLSDKLFEIGLTPNRPDCLSIIGIAREVAAIRKKRVSYPDTNISDKGNAVSEISSVRIEAPDHCPRYAARLVENVRVAPSPFWLQDRLMSVGLRPINNIVDITNFILMEMGQPLHAFDFDRLAGQRIAVRTAAKGEQFTTLDGKERILSPEMLMICDGEKAVAVAGVMGGLNSEIEDSTTRVFIESAYFSPVGIRKTAKKLGLNTEASHRFERGIDPEGTVKALNRAAMLMAELGGGRLVSGLIDEHPKPSSRKKIFLSTEKANRLLDTRLKQSEMADILLSVEFSVEKADEDQLAVTPPSFRVDVSRPEDLAEELARLWGYEKIPVKFPMIPSASGKISAQSDFRYGLKQLMTGFGFTEAVNYSFIHNRCCDQLQLGSDDPRRQMLNVLNPLAEDQSVMRTSLIPGLLETMRRNISQQVRTLKVFEIGKTFISRGQDDLPEEKEMLAGLWTGSRYDLSWHSQDTACDFYDIKGIAESLAESLKISGLRFTAVSPHDCAYTKPGASARIFAGNETLGLTGEIHQRCIEQFDLRQNAFIFEMDMNVLGSLIPDVKQSRSVPRYPFVPRDITLIVEKNMEAGTIPEQIRNMGEALVEDVTLFAVYEGASIPEGRKSVSFRIIYRSAHETLEDSKVNWIHKGITDRLIHTFNASLPA